MTEMKRFVRLGLIVVSAVLIFPPTFTHAVDGVRGDVLVEAVLGCMQKRALNYNPEATQDDGTCIFVRLGCTDFHADNFMTEANRDDGSCTYSLDGRSCISKAWSEKIRCKAKAVEYNDLSPLLERELQECIQSYNRSVFQCGCAHNRAPDPLCFDLCARELRKCQDESEIVYYSCVREMPYQTNNTCRARSTQEFNRCKKASAKNAGAYYPSCVEILNKPPIPEPTPSPTPPPTPNPMPMPSASPTSRTTY